MFLIDDLLLRAVGLSLKPFDLIWIMELLKDYTLHEKYNMKNIGKQIKENRLLFEIGAMSEEEYNQEHQRLLEERRKAEEVMADLSENATIREL